MTAFPDSQVKENQIKPVTTGAMIGSRNKNHHLSRPPEKLQLPAESEQLSISNGVHCEGYISAMMPDEIRLPRSVIWVTSRAAAAIELREGITGSGTACQEGCGEQGW